MKTDIFILSGFLGSGKSTLLAKLLEFEKQQGRHVGVIMNEMGQVSIDSEAIPSDVPLKELLNGCICCHLQGDLSLQLKALTEEYELDAIYIESTGAAHLIEVVDACTHPLLINTIEIKGIITLVNAQQWRDGRMSIKLKKLLQEQIKYANIIILNKLDTIEEGEADSLLTRIREINQNGHIFPSTYASIDPKIILSSQAISIENRSAEQNKEDHVHLHLETFSYTLSAPIDRIEFEKGLNTFSGQLYRVKGFLKLTETPGLFLFNYSYGLPMFERCKTNAPTTLVFIGENLDRPKIEAMLLKIQSS
ncbi:CobW family GTP-binding protein [Halalkalibacter urbisdiaboli]|uniref:CobW family GTP-binding protein n=1 Tax=Halalkalibacter urbisdiaboli TaxID=1960589 RepID=UPI000B4487A7|nr:GTP-binding protein [Halalkalibacter urbisdiaboli]